MLSFGSCNKKTDNEDNGKISVSDIKKIDKIENINYKNIKCDLLEVKFDTDAEKVYDYTWSVYPLSTNEQYYNEFRAALKELFPGHAINEKAFFLIKLAIFNTSFSSLIKIISYFTIICFTI